METRNQVVVTHVFCLCYCTGLWHAVMVREEEEDISMMEKSY